VEADSRFAIATSPHAAVCLAVACLALVAACAWHAAPRGVRFPAYPAGPKMPLHVEVRLTPEYAGYEFRGSGAMGFDPKIGGVLCAHAEALANAMFERVTMSRPPVPSAGADLVMTPTVVVAHRTDVGASGETRSVMAIQWRVEDAGGRVVWVGTSKGEAAGKRGTALAQRGLMEEQLQALLDDTFERAYTLMIASPELRVIAAR
jgi:hypothetical protein